MNGNGFAEKLKNAQCFEIIFTKHAELRLVQRQIRKEDAVNDLRNPKSLKLIEKLQCERNDDEKYKLWFVPSKRVARVYVIVINTSQQRIIVKTVIKQRLDWQKKVEKNAK
jgi:hypothetical protein